MTYHIECADILAWAATYDGPKFHALLCDAPYEIAFMGREWDNSGIAFNPETWAALARHLHPGAYLFVFAGTLNDDLISLAMRKAGLRKHHRALTWAYLSGFPKASRVDTVVDRRAGATRKVTRTRKHAPKFAAAEFGYREKDNGFNSRERESFDETAPATDLAATWAGHRYGQQAIKPAIEPILVFQKPYAGDAVESITATGAGALWVDGARIEGVVDGYDKPGVGRAGAHVYSGGWSGGYSHDAPHPDSARHHAAGRWPANLLLVHHPECAAACHPDCAVRRLGEQSGERTSGMMRAGTERSTGGGYHGNMPAVLSNDTYGDTGTAARMFHNADWQAERLEAADQVAYFAKASTGEREAGLDPLQVALLGAMEAFLSTTVDDGRQTPIDNPYLRGETTRRNTHATIKPISLARWLATLLLPPPAYGPRRLLIPFAGAGSEMIGAMLAGWEEVQGVELVQEHVAIARARLAYWRQRRHEFGDGRPVTASQAPAAPDGQLTIFDISEAA